MRHAAGWTPFDCINSAPLAASPPLRALYSLNSCQLQFQRAAAESLRASGVSHVIAWPSDRPPLTLPAMHFAHAFFALLRNPTVTVPEAFCIATHLTQAFTPQGPDDGSPPVEPPLPRLLSADTPSLPGPASVPPPEGIVGVEVDKPLHECLPGYEELRLLAPHAEVRLLLMGPPSMSSSYCMG